MLSNAKMDSLELTTSRLVGLCSNHYATVVAHKGEQAASYYSMLLVESLVMTTRTSLERCHLC